MIRSQGKSMFRFVRKYQTSQMAVIFCLPPEMYENSHCSTSLPAFRVFSFLELGHSKGCVIVSHYCFNLHLPDDE